MDRTGVGRTKIMYWTEREHGQEQRLKRKDFIKGGLEELSIEPPIPGDINPDWLDEPDDGNEDDED